MSNPLVSIIIPSFNRAALLPETLNCLLSQIYSNWECIIVDDGSTDNTKQVVSNYITTDLRFSYYERPSDKPKGANACRNYGFEKSKGVFIQFLDSDDLLSVNKLKVQVETFIQKPSTSVVTCKYGFFKNEIKQVNIKENEAYYNNFNTGYNLLNAFGIKGGYFPVHVYLVKREIIKMAGKWNETLVVNQDGEFFSRVLLNANTVVFVHNAIVYYRLDSGNNTSTTKFPNKNEGRIYSWRLINQNIHEKVNVKNALYVKKAKDIMFKNMFRDDAKVIYKNGFFFKKQLLKHYILHNPLLKVVRKFIKFVFK